MLQLKLDRDSNVYRPGSTLSGKIVWELKKAPRSLDAVLYWYTTGKGDEDLGEAIQQTWVQLSETGALDFSWQLPRGPLSLDAKLIHIHWKIEVTLAGSDETASASIILSHLERPVISTTL